MNTVGNASDGAGRSTVNCASSHLTSFAVLFTAVRTVPKWQFLGIQSLVSEPFFRVSYFYNTCMCMMFHFQSQSESNYPSDAKVHNYYYRSTMHAVHAVHG